MTKMPALSWHPFLHLIKNGQWIQCITWCPYSWSRMFCVNAFRFTISKFDQTKSTLETQNTAKTRKMPWVQVCQLCSSMSSVFKPNENQLSLSVLCATGWFYVMCTVVTFASNTIFCPIHDLYHSVNLTAKWQTVCKRSLRGISLLARTFATEGKERTDVVLTWIFPPSPHWIQSFFPAGKIQANFSIFSHTCTLPLQGATNGLMLWCQLSICGRTPSWKSWFLGSSGNQLLFSEKSSKFSFTQNFFHLQFFFFC